MAADNVAHPGRYRRTSGRPELSRSAVLFLDLLGTRELASAEQAPTTLLHLDEALDRARTRSQLDESWNWADSAWFSDNLVIAAPLGERADFEEGILGTVIMGAMWLQYLLAIDGFFSRGGFTIGPHFMDSRVNFGPALVRAVALEKDAVYPRVIVDESTIEVVCRHAGHYAVGADNPFEAHLMTDAKGTAFISYMAVAFEADDETEATQLIGWHRDAVLRKIDRFGTHGTVGEKYHWSAAYHNAFVDLFFATQPHLRVELPKRAWAFGRRARRTCRFEPFRSPG